MTTYKGEEPYEDEGFLVVEFLEDGVFEIPSGVTEVEVLVVGAGGDRGSQSGGVTGAGGGGSGGLILMEDEDLYEFSESELAEGQITIQVGAGAGTGGNSIFGELTANRGGNGGSVSRYWDDPEGEWEYSGTLGVVGGSGGGGAGIFNRNGANGNQPLQEGNSGTYGWGRRGGNGTGGSAGGHGGGASSQDHESASVHGKEVWGITYATGGSGVGRTGGENGGANTGNGGGSSQATGGSGIVIVRYMIPLVEVTLLTQTKHLTEIEVKLADIQNFETNTQGITEFNIEVEIVPKNFWEIKITSDNQTYLINDLNIIRNSKLIKNIGKIPDHFEIQAINPDGVYNDLFKIGNVIQYYIGAENSKSLIFTGVIEDRGILIPEKYKNYIEIIGIDYGSYRTKQTIISEVIEIYDQTPKKILETIFDKYCPDLSLDFVENFETIPYIRLGWEYVNQAIEKIANLTISEYYFDENKQLHLFPKKLISTDYELNDDIIFKAEINQSSAGAFDRIFIIGGKQGYIDNEFTSETKMPEKIVNEYIAQKFQPTNRNLNYIEMYMSKLSNVPINVEFSIVEDNGGNPTGFSVGRGRFNKFSVGRNANWVKSSILDITVDPEKTYWIVIEPSTGFTPSFIEEITEDMTWNPPESVDTIQITIIGGGGGGGAGRYRYDTYYPGTRHWHMGGGGGSGGIVYIGGENSYSITEEDRNNGIEVTIGKGGNGSESLSQKGQNGEDTVFGDFVAKGGGGGGSGSSRDGAIGGSGGGGGKYNVSGGSMLLGQGANGNQPLQEGESGEYGWGRRGGNATTNWDWGGAGRGGGASSQDHESAGHSGKLIWGKTYATGGLGGKQTLAGHYGPPMPPPSDASPNTGNGGSGGNGTEGWNVWEEIFQKGSNGGSGIVLVRYDSEGYFLYHDDETTNYTKTSENGQNWNAFTGKFLFRTYYGVQIIRQHKTQKIGNYHIDGLIVDNNITDINMALSYAEKKLEEFIADNTSEIEVEPIYPFMRAGQKVKLDIINAPKLKDQLITSSELIIEDVRIDKMLIRTIPKNNFYLTFAEVFSNLRKMQLENIWKDVTVVNDYINIENENVILLDNYEVLEIEGDYTPIYDNEKSKWGIGEWE